MLLVRIQQCMPRHLATNCAAANVPSENFHFAFHGRRAPAVGAVRASDCASNLYSSDNQLIRDNFNFPLARIVIRNAYASAAWPVSS
jgi:hypothetical protein